MLFNRRNRPSKRERTRIALWPRRSFRRSYHYYKHRVLRLEASPHAIAAGVAAGAFASCTPFVGFHILLALALAWLVGGSLIAAAIGTAVGNPLTFPVIWVTSFQLGEFILGGGAAKAPPNLHHLSFSTLAQSGAAVWPTLKPMVVGGVLMGLVVGGVSYVLVRSAVAVRHEVRRVRLAELARHRAADGEAGP